MFVNKKFVNKKFVNEELITKITKILCHENLELYGMLVLEPDHNRKMV